eukprot:GILJ01003916.1.p1 GENE.GILJ01003916.1~~GILJ01003916.1.p1  ORF type:complete len:249 (-),score=37.00 GILJ01003916.1:189-908(-)
MSEAEQASSNTENSSTNPSQGSVATEASSSGAPVKRLVRAIADFSDADQLNFKEGDLITVITADDSGWWYGSLNNTEGWFPATYVEEYQPPADKDSTSQDPKTESTSTPQVSSWEALAQQYTQEYISTTVPVVEPTVADPYSVYANPYANTEYSYSTSLTGGPPRVTETEDVSEDYKSTAYFNQFTGKYATAASADNNPSARGFRQCSYYFDYEAWNEQQNQLKAKKGARYKGGKKPKL